MVSKHVTARLCFSLISTTGVEKVSARKSAPHRRNSTTGPDTMGRIPWSTWVQYIGSANTRARASPSCRSWSWTELCAWLLEAMGGFFYLRRPGFCGRISLSLSSFPSLLYPSLFSRTRLLLYPRFSLTSRQKKTGRLKTMITGQQCGKRI